jgi:branched-chain amino acid transport system substrate-binding protein
MLATACSSDDGESSDASDSTQAGADTTIAEGEALSGDPIRIGVLVDRSGVVVFSSQQMVDGLEAVVDAVNSGELFWGDAPATTGEPGILGRPIELVFEDTQANPNQALLATQALASQGVAAIIGTTTSPDAIQAKVGCQEAQIPCIFPTVSAADIVAPPNNDFSFTMAPNFDVQAQQMVEAVEAAGHQNISIVVDDTGAAATLAASFTSAFEEADFPVASIETIPATAQDVTSQIERLRSEGPDAVLDLVVPSTLNALFVRQFKSSGIDAELFAINPLVTQPQIPEDIGPSVDGTVVIDQMDRGAEDVGTFTDYFQELH